MTDNEAGLTPLGGLVRCGYIHWKKVPKGTLGVLVARGSKKSVIRVCFPSIGRDIWRCRCQHMLPAGKVTRKEHGEIMRWRLGK